MHLKVQKTEPITGKKRKQVDEYIYRLYIKLLEYTLAVYTWDYIHPKYAHTSKVMWPLQSIDSLPSVFQI